MSQPSGYVLWDGRSRIDGKPIVVIATLSSRNRKTGDCIQTWILRQDKSPVEAVSTGDDLSICGDCPLRGCNGKSRSCYVNVGQAPLQVWKAYKRGAYPKIKQADYSRFHGRLLRIGSYGDPTAVPFQVWEEVAGYCERWVGYSHRWDQPDTSQFKQLTMASCETPEKAKKAQSLGWRTFRIMRQDEQPQTAEKVCPASRGKTSCDRCGLCHGTSNKPHVAIQIHGGPARESSFHKMTA